MVVVRGMGEEERQRRQPALGPHAGMQEMESSGGGSGEVTGRYRGHRLGMAGKGAFNPRLWTCMAGWGEGGLKWAGFTGMSFS